jgi:hypothetical protein
MVAAAAAGAPGHFELRPQPDERDHRIRLHVPPGFRYRSFHDTESDVPLDGGSLLPGRHDGMAAFPAGGGNVWLVRNHEVNNAVPAFGAGTPYDAMAGGGTTTVLVTPFGEVLDLFTSCNGTQMNCSGGATPWGSWLTCEETVNGPDVGPDFTTRPNIELQQRHGYVFEVPAGGQSNRVPIRSAGRFAHEAAAWDPVGGKLYLTEDNFEFPSGFYRYTPPSPPTAGTGIADGGTLEMLRVVGVDEAHLEAGQADGQTYAVSWVPIGQPDVEFAYTPGEEAPTSNDDALNFVGNQGRALGAAGFSRLEGAAYQDGEIWFTSTQGGGAAETGPESITGYGNGTGQVWSYAPATDTLTCRFQSPGASALELPDNVGAHPGGGPLVVCEDGPADNYLRGLREDGTLFDIALNRLRSSSGSTRFGDEFAGATWSPDGHTLFVNIQASRGMTFAIWGPWDRLGF